ncbi:MAG: hypothetical protein PVJ39_11390 [Gammaproteobacteria bacterium]|jgi:hypothetical protein
MVNRITIIALIVLLAFAATEALAKDKTEKKSGGDAKALSGISIVGNKEAPKSLFIVPWKSSELGVESGLSSQLLNEKLKAVDKDVFERELDFYSATVQE